MQKTIVIGNIGQTAEVKKLESGSTVVKFSVAHNENWKNKAGEKQSKTTWFDCSYWTEKTAIAEYLVQGSKVCVEGVVSARGWIDKNGAAQASIDLRVERIELIGKVVNNETGTEADDAKDDLPF